MTERRIALCKQLLIVYKGYCPQDTQCKVTLEHFLFGLRAKISKKAFLTKLVGFPFCNEYVSLGVITKLSQNTVA